MRDQVSVNHRASGRHVAEVCVDNGKWHEISQRQPTRSYVMRIQFEQMLCPFVPNALPVCDIGSVYIAALMPASRALGRQREQHWSNID